MFVWEKHRTLNTNGMLKEIRAFSFSSGIAMLLFSLLYQLLISSMNVLQMYRISLYRHSK